MRIGPASSLTDSAAVMAIGIAAWPGISAENTPQAELVRKVNVFATSDSIDRTVDSPKSRPGFPDDHRNNFKADSDDPSAPDDAEALAVG